MRRATVILALALAVLAESASAQDRTTTQSAGISGTTNCTFIQGTATRTVQTSGATQTWLQISVKTCPTGSTVPTTLEFSRYLVIPDTDLQFTSRGAQLHTSIPEGEVVLSWTVTRATHNSYQASWIWDGDAETPRRQSDQSDTYSATPTGTVGSRIADGRTGYILSAVGTQK